MMEDWMDKKLSLLVDGDGNGVDDCVEVGKSQALGIMERNWKLLQRGKELTTYNNRAKRITTT
jgi:hypothetical protein